MSQQGGGWPGRLIEEFDAADRRARALAGGLSRQQLNWKPAPSQWSVGQCVEHLCVASDVYSKPIADSLPGHPESGVEEIKPGWFGAWFVRTYIEPSEKTRKAPAPRKIKPGTEVELSVFDRFIEGNNLNRELVRRAAKLDVNRIRFRNPFLPWSASRLVLDSRSCQNTRAATCCRPNG